MEHEPKPFTLDDIENTIKNQDGIDPNETRFNLNEDEVAQIRRRGGQLPGEQKDAA